MTSTGPPSADYTRRIVPLPGAPAYYRVTAAGRERDRLQSGLPGVAALALILAAMMCWPWPRAQQPAVRRIGRPARLWRRPAAPEYAFLQRPWAVPPIWALPPPFVPTPNALPAGFSVPPGAPPLAQAPPEPW